MSKTILIVDDNESDRQTLRGFLEADFAVLEARDGQKALSIMHQKSQSIVAVLLDISIPVMDGYQILEAVQAEPELSKIPIVIITDASSIEAEKKAIALGAADCVTRPFVSEIVRHRLDAIINARTTSQYLEAIINNVGSGFTIFSIDGTQTMPLVVSERYYGLLGYTREQFENEVDGYFDPISPLDKDRVLAELEELGRTTEALVLEFRATRRDGSEIWLRDTVSVTRVQGVDVHLQLGVFTDITEMKRAEEDLRGATDQMAAILGNIDGGISAVILDDCGVASVVFANESYYSIQGYTKEQFEKEVGNLLFLVVGEDRERVRSAIGEVIRRRGRTSCEFRCIRRDGGVVYLRCSVSVTAIKNVGDTVLLAMISDITASARAAQKERETMDALRVREEEYRLAIEHSGTFIYRYNHADDSVDLSENVAALLGLPQHLTGAPDSLIVQDKMAEETREAYREFFRCVKRGDAKGNVIVHRRVSDGRWRWFEGLFFTIYNESGTPSSTILVFEDITKEHEDQKKTAEQLKQAELDGMTGIYNRATVEKVAKRKLAAAKGDSCALLIVDLDNLKDINDTLGHLEGDRAIVQLARQLHDQFRHTDVVGRVGGDEFVAVLIGVTEELLNSIIPEFMYKVSALRVGENDDHSMSCSIGIAMGDSPVTYGELFKKADKALYCRKRTSKGGYAFYNPEIG